MRLALLITLITCLTPLHAASYFQVDEIGSSAKSIGLGNIQGLHHSADVIFENPATLSSEHKQGYSLFSTKLENDVTYLNGALYLNKKKWGVFGIGLMQTKINDLYHSEEVDGKFVETGNFSYLNRLIKTSFKPHKTWTINDVININFGASLSSYYTRIDTVIGTAKNIDLGSFITFPKNKLSIILNNFQGKKMHYSNNASESIKKTLIISHEFQYRPRFNFYSQLNRSSGETSLISYGISTQPPVLKNIQLNAGMKSVFVHKSKTKEILSAGLTLRLKESNIHYAIEHNPATFSNYTHYFSLDFNQK